MEEETSLQNSEKRREKMEVTQSLPSFFFFPPRLWLYLQPSFPRHFDFGTVILRDGTLLRLCAFPPHACVCEDHQVKC